VPNFWAVTRPPRVEFDKRAQVAVAEFGEPGLTDADDGVGELAFAHEHVGDAFLEGPAGHELVDVFAVALPDPVGAVGRLVLDRRVPPAVVVQHVRGTRQVEPEPARLEAADQHLGALGSSWNRATMRRSPPHPAGEGETAVQERDLGQLQRLGEVLDEQVTHDPVLGEDERTRTGGDHFGQHLRGTGELARPARERSRFTEVLGGVVADSA
jgi:hypothetical protein